jgi:hypothetical protein
MTTPALALVPLARINLNTTTEEDIDGVRRRMDPAQHHELDMAEALERVVARVAIPRSLDGTMQLLTALLDTAVMARVAANAMAAPAIQRRRPTHPGHAFGAAENAAQLAAQAYRAQLRDTWPVTEWCQTLSQVALVAAREGAWGLLGIVGEGLQGAPGSLEWWDAVVHVSGLWGDRHYAPGEPSVG